MLDWYSTINFYFLCKNNKRFENWVKIPNFLSKVIVFIAFLQFYQSIWVFLQSQSPSAPVACPLDELTSISCEFPLHSITCLGRYQWSIIIFLWMHRAEKAMQVDRWDNLSTLFCYLIRSSSYNKPHCGDWASGRDGMRRGSRSRGDWWFRGWAGRSRCCTSHIVAQRLEDVLAEVAQILDYWLWCVVVDLATTCCLACCKLRQLEVFWKLNIVHDDLILEITNACPFLL